MKAFHPVFTVDNDGSIGKISWEKCSYVAVFCRVPTELITLQGKSRVGSPNFMTFPSDWLVFSSTVEFSDFFPTGLLSLLQIKPDQSRDPHDGGLCQVHPEENFHPDRTSSGADPELGGETQVNSQCAKRGTMLRNGQLHFGYPAPRVRLPGSIPARATETMSRCRCEIA